MLIGWLKSSLSSDSFVLKLWDNPSDELGCLLATDVNGSFLLPVSC